MKHCKKGFTLVELLAVIVILGIILTIAVALQNKDDPNYIKLLDSEAKANDWSKKAIVIVDILKKMEGEK
jgi:prepilin-type N-terminal cleavage/methylation domain-containing protein